MERLMTIPESGMTFGPFAQDQVFHIEKSKLYTGKGIRDNGVQTVEFILKRTGKRVSLAFIEASFRTLDHSQVSIKLFLVIRGHTADGLDPIKTKLEQVLKAYRAIWKLEIVVMNDKMAAKRGLIQNS